MTQDPLFVLAILAATMGMFLWGRWRHDMVAAGALLACVVGGLVAAEEAFAGFGHPAVITVACVLVLGQGRCRARARWNPLRSACPGSGGLTSSLPALLAMGALLSGFMNNVGAMALLMPVAMRLWLPASSAARARAHAARLRHHPRRHDRADRAPPNLIMSGFRAQQGAGAFGMFDFAHRPGGRRSPVASSSCCWAGAWCRPAEKASTEGFETGAYVTEVRVGRESKAAGMFLREIEARLDDAGAQVIGLVRDGARDRPRRAVTPATSWSIEADVEALPEVLSGLGLELEEAGSSNEDEQAGSAAATADAEGDEARAVQPASAKKGKKQADGRDEEAPPGAARDSDKPSPDNEIVLMELVVRPEASLINRSARDLALRTRYGLNPCSRCRARARAPRPGCARSSSRPAICC